VEKRRKYKKARGREAKENIREQKAIKQIYK
jgi:hypothetical protein